MNGQKKDIILTQQSQESAVISNGYHLETRRYSVYHVKFAAGTLMKAVRPLKKLMPETLFFEK